MVKGIGLQVFGDRSFGNCYKIELFCSILKIDHDWLDIDVLAGDTHKAVFRKLNPNGKIPFVTLHDGNTLAEYKEWHVHGVHALNVMEHNLAKHGFFGGYDPSIADIALFAYTHVADQGGFELQKYPAITRWIDDTKSISGYTPITERLD